MRLVDTDVLIWNLRGNEAAARLLDGGEPFIVSAVSYMELLQGLRDNQELRTLRRALRFWGADLLHLNEEISARAMFLVEEYALSHNMQMADALIAAGALYLGVPLVTANDRHYRHIKELEILVFRPRQ
ncbi:type II toxin-antitoxin system VapC family toxin [Alloalcanivorax marinus]|uniref:type II toxin-antitoxin system VapC family toxin n=1 Tax=Alloalcanivorax marinus TaxID=1177169 RepID=UPI001931DEBE|nr:type II toxin-antitoxin system VapC family toxin [Alloalcanivorax marinus]MBL7249476.1 type II toxin-antitoxin system VapC family toxin [Alloalcanivorax marinus]